MKFNFINSGQPKCSNINSWIQEYKNLRPNEEIHYLNGGKQTSDKYEFNSLSNHLQKQQYMTIYEFSNLLQLRTNISNSFDSNRGKIIKKHTEKAISAHLNRRVQLRELCKLRGVGVPRASILLTAIFPDDYAMIDLQRVRAFIAWFRHQPSTYSEHANLTSLLQKYDTIKGYIEYNKVLNKISQNFGHSHRELGMALWAYDQKQI